MSDIASASRRGLTISFVSQGMKFILQFVLSVVLARILQPSDFGLVAMAAPLLAFAQLFGDLGLTQATVLRPEISQDELSFTFWITVGVSVGLGALIALSAPLAAAFYHEPRVAMIVVVLGGTLVFGGLSAQHTALLNRRLRFGSLAIVEIGAFTVGGIAAIAAALAGWSYWAVVLNQVVVSLATMIIAWIASGWRPSRFRNVKAAREILSFGGNVTGFNFVNFFSRNMDNLLIGRVLGERPLGLYDRAYKLLLLPLSQITGPIAKVAIPMLARTAEDPDVYRRGYLRMLETVLLLTYPAVVVAGVAGRPLIVTVLGPQWAGAAPVFQILAVGALFAPIGNSTGWLFLTQNRSREMRNYGVLSSIAFVSSFFAGLPWGITGVAAAYIGVGCIQGPLIWWAATRSGPVRFRDLLQAIAPYAFAAIPVAMFSAYIVQAVSPGWIMLAVTLAAGYLIFLGSMCFLPSGRRALVDVYLQVAKLVNSQNFKRGPVVTP